MFDKAQGTLLIYPNAKSGSSYTVPNSVTNIADAAFYGSPNLQKVVLGPRITILQGAAFESCPQLAGVYCLGDAPALGGNFIFYGNTNVVYYLAGTAGWGATLQERPDDIVVAAESADFNLLVQLWPQRRVQIPVR